MRIIQQEQKYTYFTSPICRYVDIVAHRQIATAIRYGNLHDSIRSRRKQGGCAASACGIGTHSSPQGSCKVLRRLGIEGAAHGGGLRHEDIHNGFVVFVPRFGVQGLIQARYLPPVEPETAFDAENYVLTIHGSSKRSLALFAKVAVFTTNGRF